MPVVDYSKTLIYKIQNKELDELLYVGHTTHFLNRKVQHKRNCYNPNAKSYNLKLYTTIRDNGGWDAFNMVVIKEFPCKNKQEALTEEDRVMRQTKSSLNMYRAYLTPDEKQERNREQCQRYYQQHSEQLGEKNKQYRELHREDILEYHKKYNEDNREHILEHMKGYYKKNREKRLEYNEKYKQQNKDKLSEKNTCLCGGKYGYSDKARHLKSKKHQEYLNQQTDQ